MIAIITWNLLYPKVFTLFRASRVPEDSAQFPRQIPCNCLDELLIPSRRSLVARRFLKVQYIPLDDRFNTVRTPVRVRTDIGFPSQTRFGNSNRLDTQFIIPDARATPSRHHPVFQKNPNSYLVWNKENCLQLSRRQATRSDAALLKEDRLEATLLPFGRACSESEF